MVQHEDISASTVVCQLGGVYVCLTTSFPRRLSPLDGLCRPQGLTVVQQHLILDVVSMRRRGRVPGLSATISAGAQPLHPSGGRSAPWGWLPSLSLRLHGRRFRCLNRTCPRQTFRERVAGDRLFPTNGARQRLKTVSKPWGSRWAGKLEHAWWSTCSWQ